MAILPSHMWCTPTKQGTSRKSLFWDMGNWSWHRGDKWISCRFWDICFFMDCNVFYHLHVIWDMILKHFQQKILDFLHPVISKTIGIGNFKGRFLKITLREKLLKILYTNGHIWKSRRSIRSLHGLPYAGKASILSPNMRTLWRLCY